MVTTLTLLIAIAAACSTTYRFRGEDLERVRAGAPIANINDPSGDAVDFTEYSFVYRAKDAAAPLRIKGVESLNRGSQEGMLKDAQSLDASPEKGYTTKLRTAGICWLRRWMASTITLRCLRTHHSPITPLVALSACARAPSE